MADITLTENQKLWLASRGGRNINDVVYDPKDPEGLFVLMGDGNGKDIRVYLPVSFYQLQA